MATGHLMIWLAWFTIAWADAPAEAACDLTKCPPGHEARTCGHDVAGRGDCTGLQAQGWQPVCTGQDGGRSWQVVCRSFEPPSAEWRPGDPGCGLTSCPPGQEVQTCGDGFEMDGECSRLEPEGWRSACQLANRDKSWVLVVCRPAVVAPVHTAPARSPASCGAGCDAGGASTAGPWLTVLLGRVALHRRRRPAARRAAPSRRSSRSATW